MRRAAIFRSRLEVPMSSRSVGVAQVVVGEPLAQVAADVEAVVALVPVDEVEHEAQ